MNVRAPKGTADMLPDVARAWEYLTRTAQDLFSRYGYEPIYTPLFENTEVFTRGIGEATDIVSKEMYTFLDKGDRSLTLRPEGTASVVRAALEHSLVPQGSSAKLYYSGPMFRYERPQKGRMRQFWQIGVEVLGVAGPSADAEVIVLLVRFFEAVGIPAASMRLLVNSMGDEACRPAYRERISAYIRDHGEQLCEECNRRAVTNPLRAFDCKNPACVAVMAEAPLLRDSLCEECSAHYSTVKAHLDRLGIAYEEAPRLVRGLDYYTRTVFEVQVTEGLGSQNAIGGGGRYDRLMQEYGGPPTPGLGFALGFERTLLAMEAAGVSVPAPARADVYVARVDDSVSESVFTMTAALRDAGVVAELDHQARSLKSQFKQADRLAARLVVIVGPDELAVGEVTLRDMTSKDESRVAIGELVNAVRSRLG
ncbi:MAG: histidine--tRNA ligase [Actinomycetota bacterium]|nr:MAG: histidyl-tRNA [Actinomycetota bacterium]MDO8949303.1 histidine--tRNA ligase [Actinomycetota bacterium]MDP3630717.1 histidine--tRNA ligase [Actinomycetota bacterium]